MKPAGCTICRGPGSRCSSATTSAPSGSTRKRWRRGPPACGNGASCCRCPRAPSRSASASRRRRLVPLHAHRRAEPCWSRTRGGCRPARSRRAGWRWRSAWRSISASRRIAMPTNGNAGAALAAYGARAGIETLVICPAETPAINVRETAAYGAEVYVANGQIDECGRIVGEGAAAGQWFDCSTLKEPYRIEGKKVMGLELAEQLGWRAARRHLLSDRRRHRPHRHVEGVRRTGGDRPDRAEAAAHVSPSRPPAARRSSAPSRPARSSPSAGKGRRPWRPASACPRRSATS